MRWSDMIAAVLFVMFAAVVGLFIASRVFVGLRDRQITVKGQTYARGQAPILYWLVLLLLTIGAVTILSMVIFCVTIFIG